MVQNKRSQTLLKQKVNVLYNKLKRRAKHLVIDNVPSVYGLYVDNFQASYSEDIVHNHNYYFNGKQTYKLLRWIEQIRIGKNRTQRRIANDKLSYIYDNSYLTNDEIKILRENRKLTIKDFGKYGKTRKDGRPYAIHGVATEWFAAENKASLEVRIAAQNHDYIEDLAKDQGFEKLTDAIINHYTELERRGMNNPTQRLKTSLILHKVTKLEEDLNYYTSIDRITNDNISFKTIGLEKLFFEHYKKLVGETKANNELSRFLNVNIPLIDAMKTVMKTYQHQSRQNSRLQSLELTTREQHEIILGAAQVKLYDRLSNSLDLNQLSFVDKTKIVLKNIYLIDHLNRYLKNPLNSSYISKKDENTIQKLEHKLMYATDKMLSETITEIIRKQNSDPSFNDYVTKINYELNQSLKAGVFNKIDTPHTKRQYLFNGKILDLWDPVMKGDEYSIDFLNSNMNEQYLTALGLKYLVQTYKTDKFHVLEGFEKIKNHKGSEIKILQKGEDPFLPGYQIQNCVFSYRCINMR